ncbi:heme exporter protein CcmD [Sphingomonas lacunae]|uniref:Heme exporter protein D n=1 Tax=Sphingomonas lacunae TaxID=2698828 RepID=A0A6M4AVS4_9SPHN|nr:heme exporter protein CcmD [Sphingomonas lacunae]QJQ33205.1 heme exporter protein CcmD [Sphingomonas lacunae]
MTSQWDFVIAAYAVTALGTVAVLLHSWMRLRRAEQQADGLRDRGETPVPPPQQ